MNQIEMAREVEERYRRYLRTTFYFKDPDLRRSFQEALDSGHLSKGPYLEATPVFKRGRTPRELFQTLLGIQPDERFLRAVQDDRPLYQHQEDAIRKVSEGRNVVVATGTGSGKTEAFLYPILLHLYREFQANQLCPGVRALILYPMNALANDQRERLGEICKQLKEADSPFRFTFGQYIGETPEHENDFQRHAGDHLRMREGYSIVENGQVVHGELVLRAEMRKTPPHILLTNYSMLEYLLLRPNDSPLFDKGRAQWWAFLVLDEAHQYRGSRGIEMAMLLRRLKQRLREGGRSEPFRCMATSATLMGGEKDRAAVAQFASELFGEAFNEDDVILGEFEPIPEPGPHTLQLDDYRMLQKVLLGQEARNRIAEIARRLALLVPNEEEIEKNIGRLLQEDRRSIVLRRRITEHPVEVQQIADEIFADLPQADRVSTLSDLVGLLLRAKDPDSGMPMLSARYHLFLRSLEGAFVSYFPKKKVFLARKAVGEGSAAFEVALCKECGQHYFVGRIQENRFVEAIRDPSLVQFGVTFLRPVEDTIEEEEEDEEGVSARKHEYYLCLRCGEISETRHGKPQCSHSNLLRVVKEDPPADEDRADQIAKCGSCGYNAGGRDPVREIIYGADGPHAVIATALYQHLPHGRKKILAFADSRQEAAFFAWYLEESYQDILSRNLILKVVRQLNRCTDQGLSLRDLATGLRNLYRDEEIMSPTKSDLELRHYAWLTLYREFLTDEPRISLEGVGLVRWSIAWPRELQVPKLLSESPWSLTEQEARELMLLLLDTMRTDRAVELRTEEGISLNWPDLQLQAAQMRFCIGKGTKGIRSWDGKTGKRAQFLVKFLMKNGLLEDEAFREAAQALRAIWEAIRQYDDRVSSNDHLLLAMDDGRRLNPTWWRLRLLEDDDIIFQCDTCGRLQPSSVRGVCPRHRCSGILQPKRVADLESNHYRLLYQEDLPGTLRVEEHTAQLDYEKAREFQREFRDGRIHVLSCSTTFELGVDLGDLDTIFLRNVPPEAFNYVQRVGRAGRRAGYPGFAITYCQRGPHDLYHFMAPERLLKGKTNPPVLRLRNEKIITRHITAVALSAFFRAFPERFARVETLFKDLLNPSGVSDLASFLCERAEDLKQALSAIVPINMHEELGIRDGTWVERVAGGDGRFALAQAEVSSDYRQAKNVEKLTSEKGDYDKAKWARDRASDIAKEEVPSFLSRKAVIPKYGFPVDVVELDTQRTQKSQEAFDVLLQRDLSIAIAEFAPTSKVVANKKLWTSYGLKKVVEREWERWWYTRCNVHNRFERKLYQGEERPPDFEKCCNKMVTTQYIDPKFGFVTSRDKPQEPKTRPSRIYTTRPYFAGFKDRQGDEVHFGFLTLTKVSPGYMIVLCEGRKGKGFYICNMCGFGGVKSERSHKTSLGQQCNGKLAQVSLGHELVTDVLQLEFHLKPEGDGDAIWFAHSLAYAILEGAAEVLEVPPTDLNATVAYSREASVPPIILYDNVPGGAGLVARLEDERVLRDCLKAAEERVGGKCGCEEFTSCYGCLRSYRNQFAHHYLRRGPVLGYIGRILDHWTSQTN